MEEIQTLMRQARLVTLKHRDQAAKNNTVLIDNLTQSK